MALKRIVAVPGGTAQTPMLAVEDDDTSPADVATAIATHAALVSGVHGLGGGGVAVDQDYYVDGVTGSDANTGLTKLVPLATWSGFVARYGMTPPPGSKRRVHFAGTGGADPWVTPLTTQTYDEDCIDIGTNPLIGNHTVLRGPTNMVLATPATGPATAALDAAPASQIVDETGAANPAGYRTELLFTGAAPGWTVADLGPSGINAFLRVTRVGAKRYFEIPIADNIANSIIVDTVGGIVADLQAADTVEIVQPGAIIRGATDHGGGLRFLTVLGRGALPAIAALVAADQGCIFERLTLDSMQCLGSIITLDRVALVVIGLGESIVHAGGSVHLQNCVAGDTMGFSGGIHWEIPNPTSRPDGAADPAVPAPSVGLMGGDELTIDNNAYYYCDLPTSVYHGTGAGIAVLTGGRFAQAAGCDYVGGDNNVRHGIEATDGAQVQIRGGTNTTITGGTGDLNADGIGAVAYGVGVGAFQEVAGYNGNMHQTTVAAGVPSGGMARIYV